MRLPAIQGMIERRLLVNFRVRPDVIARHLPPPFRPQVVHGWAIGGICLIRLADVRPRALPRCLGFSSENAAHRIAVEWPSEQGWSRGVFIPRRDTSSQLNVCLGGRLFPGEHHRATFEVDEADDRYRVRLTSHDRATRVSVDASVAREFGATSIFSTLEEASAFFEQGSLGYSVTGRPGVFEGLELHTLDWRVEPLDVHDVGSSFFLDDALFPEGSTEFDCALLMRDIPHEWHSRQELCCVA
ncbi:MAG: DUF2071 domain-containing protein [Planctomycetes bacterium]|nr:DUF2071 domain-containing protein [Planctomycetota bacterium]